MTFFSILWNAGDVSISISKQTANLQNQIYTKVVSSVVPLFLFMPQLAPLLTCLHLCHTATALQTHFLHSLRSSLLPMGQSVHFTSESGCGDLSPGRPGLKLINWKEHCSSYRENFHQHYANKQYCDGELKPFRVSGPDSSVCRCFGEVGSLPTPPGNSQIPAD